jgi:pimeloyl-ACP methyl ester carboxylesterase
MNYTEHHSTSFDGLSLYHREYGAPDNSNVVLCLPGLTRNSADFEAIATHLAARYRVLSPDLRGRGQSANDPNWKQYLPPTYVRDMWKLLDELHIEKVVILGTSLGGLMGMIMADQQPERLRGLVLNDIGPEVAPGAMERLMTYVGKTQRQPDWATAIATTRANYELAYPDENEEFWALQSRATWREAADGKLEPAYDPAIGQAVVHAVKSLKLIGWLRKLGFKRLKGLNLNPWDNFRAVTMPCLLLHGELSDILIPDIIERMRLVKPDMTTVTVRGRGHVPTLSEPEAQVALDEFLGRLA